MLWAWLGMFLSVRKFRQLSHHFSLGALGKARDVSVSQEVESEDTPSPFLSRSFGRGQTWHDISPLPLKHGVHLGLNLKCIHAIWSEHLGNKVAYTHIQQLSSH